MQCTTNAVQKQFVKSAFQPYYKTLCTLTEQGKEIDEDQTCKVAIGRVILGKLGRQPFPGEIQDFIEIARIRAQEFIDNIPTLQSKIVDRVAVEILCLIPSTDFTLESVREFRIMETKAFTGMVHTTASTLTVSERNNQFTDGDILGMF